jgi:hypothetical protein
LAKSDILLDRIPRSRLYQMTMFEIVTVASGAKSLRCLERKETFHPKVGPMLEATSLHVEQQKIAARAPTKSPFILWDVGLGAGANAIAALQALSTPAELHSFDLTLDPLQFVLANSESFPYLAPFRSAIKELLSSGETTVGQTRWFFHFGDFRQTMKTVNRPPHSVFYDPYSPKTNGELWTLEHFSQLVPLLDKDCLLTNYSRSTAVRVTLLLAGFYVGIGQSIGEKAETTIFSPRAEGIANPLTKDWFKRVLASRNSAPTRSNCYELAPISAEDFAKLQNHSQFTNN